MRVTSSPRLQPGLAIWLPMLSASRGPILAGAHDQSQLRMRAAVLWMLAGHWALREILHLISLNPLLGRD